jgi:hypothetical protein
MTLAALPTAVRETVADRVRRLQAEAQHLARGHVDSLVDMMRATAATAAEIADGGDAYGPGARNEARTLAEDLARRIETLTAIQGRARS